MPLLLCPNDNAPMQTVQRSGVEFDICPTCRGVWLDRGELEKLLESDGTPPPVASKSQGPWASQDRAPPPQDDYRRSGRRPYDDDDDDDHHRRHGRRRSIFDIFD